MHSLVTVTVGCDDDDDDVAVDDNDDDDDDDDGNANDSHNESRPNPAIHNMGRLCSRGIAGSSAKEMQGGSSAASATATFHTTSSSSSLADTSTMPAPCPGRPVCDMRTLRESTPRADDKGGSARATWVI
jgi:hypothetical protein